ncbi:unnamed protein product [Cryptosporidium hominis]|uniref:Conserved oligomeric Golgi complex subunit 3 n=1 Tax=Cryptosporidium hominis TaxID=237895 RepID=A0A0S4TEX9_CRYHO|nr:hypothetical protein ChTU502y2012_401g0135 [Cryptosporidium hominis]PPA65153.1 hypothetical protein ChUKH1_15710 [Cryptosporidium hominis]CUV05248.1 unnamed protein product [Cryptosporidium hominis]
MNSEISIDGDSISPSRRPSMATNNSANLIPESSIKILRNISEQFNRLTFVSGIVVPKKQYFSEELFNKTILYSDNCIKNIFKEDLVESQFNKLEMIKTSFNIIKNEWDDILYRNTINKKNLEQLESRKVEFIGNTSCFQSICDTSISQLGNLESQARIIEEYIFPYQQYTIIYYKLQNDKFSNNLKEISSCFEIIDNSIIFFKNHVELKRTDYYIEGYKKLRVRLCCIIKNIMKNILNDCQVKNSVDENHNITEISSQPLDYNGENKGGYNISLYFTQLRAKGKLFNEYIKLLMQRYKETLQNETYRSTIEEMERYYIELRISDECCGVRSFIKFGSKKLYSGKNSQNCLALNIKSFTRLVLNYCKYEWATYKSFFCCQETRDGKNENKIYEIQRLSRELGNKINASKKNIEFNNYFSSLIERFGNEYYNALILQIKAQRDPELLRESIQYLSQDIVNISNDLYQSVSFPDIYLSSLLHYIIKLQSSILEQLMYCTEAFIKEKIQDYELKVEELNYPEILQLFSADKRLIRSLQSLEGSASNISTNRGYLSKASSHNNSMEGEDIEVTNKSLRPENNKNHYERELLTNVSFPPNKIRLQTNSDAEDFLFEDEYFDIVQEESEKSINDRNTAPSNESCQKQNSRAINVSIGCYPVVKNALLALSYIDNSVPNSSYLFLNKLIIQKCCDKLVSAKEFICNEFYLNDKISRIYHGNLFIVRNLLYLKYELINLSRQNNGKEGFDVFERNLCELESNEKNLSNTKITESNLLIKGSNLLCFKVTLDSIVNIVDVLINSNLEEMINNICSNISLPLTKIVLQVHPEIQSSDIKELQCTNHKYIRESIELFWKNLKFHTSNYILKYLNLYLSIAGKEEMETLFYSIITEIGYEGDSKVDIDCKQSNESCNGEPINFRNSGNLNSMGYEYDKAHLNSVVSSILPSPVSIFLSIKEVLIGVIFEFDHVLNKRLGIEKSVIEEELDWKLQNIIKFLNSVENKLDSYENTNS